MRPDRLEVAFKIRRVSAEDVTFGYRWPDFSEQQDVGVPHEQRLDTTWGLGALVIAWKLLDSRR